MKDLIFVHIPKTGGMSVRKALADAGHNVFGYGRGDDKKTPADLAHALSGDQYNVICGHFHNGLGVDFDDLRLQTRVLAVVLRDPITRFYSHYRYYCMDGTGGVNHPLKRAAMTSLEAFARVYPTNAQATQLAGTHPETDGELYAEAMVALQLFDRVGVTEKLHVAFRNGYIRQGLGFGLPRENESKDMPHTEPMTADVRNIVRANNLVDIAIWREAVRLSAHFEMPFKIYPV